MDLLTEAVPVVPAQAWPFIIIWTVVIKGLALWRSARLSQKYWFIIMLILNLFGFLELIYLIFFSEGFISELLGKTSPKQTLGKSPKKKSKK